MFAWMQRMGSAVCHQMAERSFMIEGMQMPLCARCTGIYIGAFFAFFYLFLHKRLHADTLTLPQAIITALAIIPVGIDGVGSYLGFWESSQLMRVFTGSLVGAVTPGFLLAAGNSDPKKTESQYIYGDTIKLLLLLVIPVNYGLCLDGGVPAYGVSSLITIAGEVLLWGGVVWLLLQNILKNRNLPYWRISFLISFAGLFLIGGMVP